MTGCATLLQCRWSPASLLSDHQSDAACRRSQGIHRAGQGQSGKFSYGSSGPGTAIHLASELFKAAAGVDIVHVPYRGNAGVMPDLLAGRIAMLIDGVPAQAKNIQSAPCGRWP